ncbi:8-oxo-dGTP diphosphatase MutT [Marinicella sediminis]|uniref:8-oxo-dGTP diphosphatase n=1 Tax=Marinicella sediminis TaxID=1792834 RepID=A0ABV7JC17_9GAMM|nr:8-oxo-dGTP diphosphatase MutT [Marinicella sediminis]
MPRQTDLSHSKHIQVVVLILENQSGNYLITQRKKTAHLGGYWEFPGGKVEPGESFLTALRRESQEELAYQPHDPSLLLHLDHSYPEQHVSLYFYHQLDPSAKVIANEQQAMRWVSLKELHNTQLPPANLPVLEYLAASEE